MKIGILFPGQGTQHAGMGRNWYHQERIVQNYFQQASDCTGVNLNKLCFGSPIEELKKPVNAQLSIFVVSTALYKVLQAHTGMTPAMVAGHSSGEYAAVHAAGTLNFTDALYLLHRRAQLMEQATKQLRGTMLAVLGLSYPEVRALCAAYDVPGSEKKMAEVAAYNGPQHTVVACSKLLLSRLKAAITAAGGRSMQISVAGAYHSRFMDQAQEDLLPCMAKVRFHDASIPLVANVSSQTIMRANAVAHELGNQMRSPVQWWDSMKRFAFCDMIIQVGPGRTYANILKRHWPEKRIFSFNEPEDLDGILRVLSLARRPAQPEVEIA